MIGNDDDDAEDDTGNTSIPPSVYKTFPASYISPEIKHTFVFVVHLLSRRSHPRYLLSFPVLTFEIVNSNQYVFFSADLCSGEGHNTNSSTSAPPRPCPLLTSSSGYQALTLPQNEGGLLSALRRRPCPLLSVDVLRHIFSYLEGVIVRKVPFKITSTRDAITPEQYQNCFSEEWLQRLQEEAFYGAQQTP